MTRPLAEIRAQKDVAVSHLRALAELNTALSAFVSQNSNDTRESWHRTADQAARQAIDSARGTTSFAAPDAVQIASEAVARASADLIDAGLAWLAECQRLAVALRAETDALDVEAAACWQATIDQLKAPDGNK